MAFVLLFLAGSIEVWGKFHVFPPGVLEFIAGFGLMTLVGSLMLGIGIAAPSMRHLFAPIAFTLFGSAVLGRVFPGSAFSLLTITEGGVRVIAGLITTGLFVHLIFYGRWTDRLFRSGRSKVTARATSLLEAEALWHGLVPTPGRREDLHDPDVLSVDWVDRDRTRVRVIRWTPPLPKYEEYIQVEDMLSDTYVLYSYVNEIKGTERIEKGIRAIKVIDLVDRRVVYITEYRHDRAARHVLFDWLDDALGRRLDSKISHLERAVARARSKKADQGGIPDVGGIRRAAQRRQEHDRLAAE
ncbi:hypothetical protein [Maritimibacter dapengensis]|uniref:Polyketide cyclase / dehydrase and lipid transport n=1 Tax=Maritimibacter dapengensis TaxID=2836868 RepID=A0ABS6T2R9_9RHOB|nr:hypothetical protein [Maritimibacter dapengensis]MBV7379554.1 hypothetical protein [Maritimibacter dapengensis]